MERDKLRLLISRYLSGTITEEEKQYLEGYWSASVHNHQQIDFLQPEEKEKLKEELYKEIITHIDKPSSVFRRKEVPESYRVGYQIGRMAATITGILLICFAAWWFLNPSMIEHTTSYGQTQQIVLPDHSVVTLNANSTLSYDTSWNTREVWLEGEAFFEVKRMPDAAFTVHAGEVAVEVLGTTFNVNERRGKTQVVLNTGKVKVKVDHQEQIHFMEPGELIEYSAREEKIQQKIVNPEMYASWRHNRLEFNDTPLYQIGQRLEDNYGYEVVITDKAVANRKFTGSAPTDTVEVLLDKLSHLFSVDIIKDGNKIIIQ